MPRKYKQRPGACRGKWHDLQLKGALKAIREEGLSVSAASRRFGIPKTTLFNHYSGKSTKRHGGKSTILTREEEHEIVVTCQVFQEIGFGLTRDMVGNVVMEYLRDIKRHNPFPNNKPGKDWWLGFMKRWPTLVERKPQHLPANRATALTENAVNAWLLKVRKAVENAGLHDATSEKLAQRMWNCDEVAFATDVASKKILARRGEKAVHETGGGSGREYITVLGCGSASGERLPPFVVYKGKNLWTSWTNAGPAGTLYSVSESGWMERSHFLDWFKKLFLPAVASQLKTGKVLLFMDGHASHINLELIKLAREKGVVLLCSPSHTTHALQPLDVGVYGPVKNSWRKILKDYKMETCAQVVDKTVFPSLLRRLWEDSFKAEHLSSGFRRAGLFPLGKENIPKSVYAPSLPHLEQPEPTTESDAHDTASNPVVHIKVTCCKCVEKSEIKIDITPVRIHLRGYFSSLIGRKKSDAKKITRRRVKPVYSGEALTSDDIYERLEEEEKQKMHKLEQKAERAKERKEKKTQKGKKATKKCAKPQEPLIEEDTEHCQQCGGLYEDDDEDRQGDWIGCDYCWRWYHYWCVGLDDCPGEDDELKCPECQ